MKDHLSHLLITIVISALVAVAVVKFLPKTHDEHISDFYHAEVAVHVSPHGLRKKMAKGEGNYILVDLRSPEEYEREHIIGAINIPAYTDPDHSAYDQVERIVGSFKEVRLENPDSNIIVYCYSIPCMTGRKIGKIVADHGVYVQLLGVGWNEWRHFWTMWNHEHEWENTNVEDYVFSGPEPGKPMIDPNYISPCVEGEFDC